MALEINGFPWGEKNLLIEAYRSNRKKPSLKHTHTRKGWLGYPAHDCRMTGPKFIHEY